jgi:hypothetical protein
MPRPIADRASCHPHVTYMSPQVTWPVARGHGNAGTNLIFRLKAEAPTRREP